jgi:hypothetical protein
MLVIQADHWYHRVGRQTLRTKWDTSKTKWCARQRAGKFNNAKRGLNFRWRLVHQLREALADPFSFCVADASGSTCKA